MSGSFKTYIYEQFIQILHFHNLYIVTGEFLCRAIFNCNSYFDQGGRVACGFVNKSYLYHTFAFGQMYQKGTK